MVYTRKMELNQRKEQVKSFDWMKEGGTVSREKERGMTYIFKNKGAKYKRI